MSDEIAHFQQDPDEVTAVTADTEDTEEEADGGPYLDLEAPEADAAEQRAELRPHGDEPIPGPAAEPEDEADPADIAEQRRVVELDEEDYR